MLSQFHPLPTPTIHLHFFSQLLLGLPSDYFLWCYSANSCMYSPVLATWPAQQALLVFAILTCDLYKSVRSLLRYFHTHLWHLLNIQIFYFKHNVPLSRYKTLLTAIQNNLHSYHFLDPSHQYFQWRWNENSF